MEISEAIERVKKLKYVFTSNIDDRDAIDTVLEELNNLSKENLEIRDWKYVIDTPLDLDKLKELDIIKIKGKEYISKNIYDELRKDEEALIRNYDKVLKLIDKE